MSETKCNSLDEKIGTSGFFIGFFVGVIISILLLILANQIGMGLILKTISP